MAYGNPTGSPARAGDDVNGVTLPSNRDFAFFWEGLAEGRLRLQRCDACNTWRCPPGPACNACGSLDWSIAEPGGQGTVHSWAVHHHPPIPPYSTPHVVVLADMAEGFRLMAHLAGVAPDDIAPGQPVRVEVGVFEQPFAMFRFRRDGEAR